MSIIISLSAIDQFIYWTWLDSCKGCTKQSISCIGHNDMATCVPCKKLKKKCQTVGVGTVWNEEGSTLRDQPEDELMINEEEDNDQPFKSHQSPSTDQPLVIDWPLKIDHLNRTDSLLETNWTVKSNLPLRSDQTLRTDQPLPYVKTLKYSDPKNHFNV
jgi:hypothetical protein